MDLNEIMGNVTTPRKCESQADFDRLMCDYNREQYRLNAPYNKRTGELVRQKATLEARKLAINIELTTIKAEMVELAARKKDVNRIFHNAKHDLIALNPLGCWNDDNKDKDACVAES